MHDFVVDFQLGSDRHIYRGLGKSKIPLVFLTIPYSHDSKIGAIDGDFDPGFLAGGQKVSPSGAKSAIFFDDFCDFSAKTVKKVAGFRLNLPKSAKIG